MRGKRRRGVGEVELRVTASWQGRRGLSAVPGRATLRVGRFEEALFRVGVDIRLPQSRC